MVFAVNENSLANSVFPICETAISASSLIAGLTGAAGSAAAAIGNAANPAKTPNAAN
jgi:hypothetical protein